MNIIEVVHTWPAQTFIQRHIEALSDAGMVPRIVMRNEHKLKTATIHPSSLRGDLLPSFGRPGISTKWKSIRYLFGRSSSINVRERIQLTFFESFNPDLIHFHDSSLAVKMHWLPERLSIPYTVSLRGSDIQILPYKSGVYNNQLLQALKAASGIHSVCDYIWKQFVDANSLETEKLSQKTIYTTVPIPEKVTDSEKWEKDEAHFITIGRLHWHKAYSNLLIAFRHFLDHRGKGKLTIVGDGSEEESLRYWIRTLRLESSVCLAGKLAYNEFSQIYSQAHAYIQSSISEGFSNSVAESMALGLPVFATNVGGTAEVIRDGENGFLLDAHRPEDWWRTLTLVEDKQRMITVGLRGRETALQTFSAQKHATDFISFFNQAIENSRHKRMSDH